MAEVIKAELTGTVWKVLVKAGDEVESGTAIGLVEIMKTFTQVAYAPTAGLPARAKVLEVLHGGPKQQGRPRAQMPASKAARPG